MPYNDKPDSESSFKQAGRFALFKLSEKQKASLINNSADFPISADKNRKKAAREASLELKNDPSLKKYNGRLELLKARFSEKNKIKGMIKNSEILAAFSRQFRNSAKFVPLINILKVRPARTISGVSPIAIMTNSKCPHGRCTYCPAGEGTANSYTGFEPAAMRGRQSGYDSYKQVISRLGQYEHLGHVTDKCELIIMGGTFNAQPRAYQENFMKRAFDAFNGSESENLKAALLKNENAKNRVIGVTFETKPDWAKSRQDIDWLLAMGATRVELGVQVLSDEIYKKVNRGHTLSDVVEATANLKNSCLKVGYHMMPGLYQTPQEDIATFKQLFEDERFRPDMLKIYPTLVLKGTKIYDEYIKGKYAPYDTNTAAQVLAKIQRGLPPYVRVMRVQRDIPANLIEAGVKNSNVRQIAEELMKKRGWACRCIRCREIGVANLSDGIKSDLERLKLVRLEYMASGGKEIFLSYEDKKSDTLAGFIRLRLPSAQGIKANPRLQIREKTALIRELHVYGQEMAIGSGSKTRSSAQHIGLGKKLLQEAEKIASEEFDKNNMVIISGIGAREYYYKQGYKPDGPYVSRQLRA